MGTAWSLTVGGVSNPRLLAEPSCLGTGIDPETGTEMEGPGDSVCASVANAVVGERSRPTIGTIGEILKSTRLFQWNVGEQEFSYLPCRVIRA